MAIVIPALGTLLLSLGAPNSFTPSSVWDLPASGLRLETLVGSLASRLGVAVLIWWALSMAAAFLASAAQLRGRTRSAEHLSKWTPSFMRRIALAALGLNLLMAPAALADGTRAPGTEVQRSAGLLGPETGGQADVLNPGRDALDPAWASADPLSGHAGPDALDPGWTPPETAPEPGPLAAVPRRTETAAPGSFREVEVRTGDSLWSIAARELGPRASELDIARAWPRWFELNRSAIGQDPDLILPGTVLAVPAPG